MIESFTSKVKTIARAAAIWRSFESSQDALAENGLKFLRGLLASDSNDSRPHEHEQEGKEFRSVLESAPNLLISCLISLQRLSSINSPK